VSDRPLLSLDSISFLDLTLPTVPENLALDEALLVEASEGRAGGSLRFWEFPDHAVVMGTSRKLAQEIHVEACRADGVGIFRRASGGGTVVIGPGALNVTVVLPETAAPGLGSVDLAQKFVMDRIASALSESGQLVELQGSGDLTIDGRKIAGSAQRRLRHWFLVHTSILYDFDLARISRYLTIPARQPDYRRGRSHEEFLSNLNLSRTIAGELVRAAWSVSSSSAKTTDVPHHLLKSLLSDRFANRSWIERF
jgi:lipoate-protein ligase A